MSETTQRRKLTIADLRPIQRIEAPPKRAGAPPPKPKVEALPETAYVPRTVHHDDDGFPCGWCFERRSWGFHRSLWLEQGIRLAVGDYTGIVQQGRVGTAEWLARNIWRVRLRTSGRRIVVGVRKGEPLTVLPDDGWQAYILWMRALEQHMPDHEPAPRRPQMTRRKPAA